jgi:hypothetical protein
VLQGCPPSEHVGEGRLGREEHRRFGERRLRLYAGFAFQVLQHGVYAGAVLVDDYDRLSGSTARSGGFTGVRIAAAASLGSPIVFVMMLAALGLMAPGGAQLAALGAAMAIYGVATGLIATSRATLPFEMFGSSGYASMLGRLSFFLNLMFAASPLLFAFIYERAGQQMALWVGLAGSLCAAIAYLRLDALVGGAMPRPEASGPA